MVSALFTLSGCISIQDGFDKTFFLPKLRDAYPHALRHLGNSAALKNVATSREPEIVLVGHGKPGVLFTANGEELGRTGERIDRSTDLSMLKSVKLLRLVGCHTGAGVEGALLLNTIARAIGATVMAPTGDVYFGRPQGATDVGLYLEDGSIWQRATPDEPAVAGVARQKAHV